MPRLRVSLPLLGAFLSIVVPAGALVFVLRGGAAEAERAIEEQRRYAADESRRLSESLSGHLAESLARLEHAAHRGRVGAAGVFRLDATGREVEQIPSLLGSSESFEAARARVARATTPSETASALVALASTCERSDRRDLAQSVWARLSKPASSPSRSSVSVALSREDLDGTEVIAQVLALAALRSRDEPIDLTSLPTEAHALLSTPDLDRAIAWLALGDSHPWSEVSQRRHRLRAELEPDEEFTIERTPDGFRTQVRSEHDGDRWYRFATLPNPPRHSAVNGSLSVAWSTTRPDATGDDTIERVMLHPALRDRWADSNLGWVRVRSPEVARVRARLRTLTIIFGVSIAIGGLTLAFVVRREGQAIARRAELVEHIAHELRTPAASLGLHAQLLADDLGHGQDDSPPHESLEWITAEAKRIGFVVEDLIDLSEPARAGPPVEPIPVGDIVTPVVTALALHARVEGIPLRVAAAPDTRVLTHRPSARRILFNLIDNALAYSRRDGEDAIDIDFELHADSVAIRVADAGRGISPDAARRIFRGGYRGALDVPGTGWGLTLSRQLALRTGATLAYTPRERGSLFTISFPLAPRRDDPTS